MTATDTGRLHARRNGSALMGVFSSLLTWNDARVTRNALGKLTDRELDDIGLCRSDITAMFAAPHR